MKDQLRKYNVAFTKTAVENEKLKEKNRTLSASLDKAKEGSVLKRLEDAKLRQDYEAALKTLDSIPPEVIRFYENRTQDLWCATISKEQRLCVIKCTRM